MIFSTTDVQRPAWVQKIARHHRSDEDKAVESLLKNSFPPSEQTRKMAVQASHFIEKIRTDQHGLGGFDAFMAQYDLSSQEGLVLMCLAESLLRIPDKATQDALIEDKLCANHWEEHLGQSQSVLVNASTLALLVSEKILKGGEGSQDQFQTIWHGLVKRSGAPVIREALGQAMRMMGAQFVLGRTIEEAVMRSQKEKLAAYRYSFDMLGEAARTAAMAAQYYRAYSKTLTVLGRNQQGRGPLVENAMSLKLSALHPRYEMKQRGRVLRELPPLVLKLAQQAKAANIALTIDAEEAARLELSLEVIEKVFENDSLSGWEGFGVAVQAYQKSAPYILDMLANLSSRVGRKIMVRLVKGAYWDSEIKLSQEQGLRDYPVFTRKSATDVSYMVCAQKLLARPDCFYAQFATHNAYTVAMILTLAVPQQEFEFQRLYGMGEGLYEQLVKDYPVRIYAPVGSHKDLLSYLVRRLLENGANTSFVKHIFDDAIPVKGLVQDPVAYLKTRQPKRHPHIAVPEKLYGKRRKNSKGIDLTNGPELDDLAESLLSFEMMTRPLEADEKQIETALKETSRTQRAWDETPVKNRAEILCRAADLFEKHRAELLGLCVKEAGKTIIDGLNELREAVDFLRYYADQALEHFAQPKVLSGPTGEHNELQLHGRGTFVCISPWNFPLAIFIGQVSAALVAGNSVIAKPAHQTTRIALVAVELLYEAGLPRSVLHLVCGRGVKLGTSLLNDPRVQGVCFTGSGETAHLINRLLAARPGAITPLIAETGGQNAMIIDSSALLEASVVDVVASAFGGAGQRCSALRVLYIQDDIADEFMGLLLGVMAEFRVGDPALLSTDIGPLIDHEAVGNMQRHVKRMKDEACLIGLIPVPKECEEGAFFSPHVFEISSIEDVGREVFGPILHVIRYGAEALDDVIEEINQTGFGLTCGLQSRLEGKGRYVQKRIHAGNFYVNRGICGAVVGVQPFGGEGLSGTGPKAGGPHYLFGFATERTMSVNIAASGGNPWLLCLDEKT